MATAEFPTALQKMRKASAEILLQKDCSGTASQYSLQIPEDQLLISSIHSKILHKKNMLKQNMQLKRRKIGNDPLNKSGHAY